jgi:hypothetical protein
VDLLDPITSGFGTLLTPFLRPGDPLKLAPLKGGSAKRNPQLPMLPDGGLRGVYHRARVRATRWLIVNLQEVVHSA